ncbi:unnamed protein product [Commensalibacter communis]|uniref:Uncharacterized protein n=1 Tax=Commensalibacter communis TaxID=2972786 RepID=A0A9W4TLT1_9PROT|nr:hypothetical protein [Commensalibacter communis]CAI3925087.1 unnamed protein product [Commensalibacter communis]CAI3925604.1 unnamed protein product [Commensalibacter communis]CAI3935725.1 unnamed protein product [Commensalibacter communis]CAI3937370.1 unnamed protein product [Commensalibacter communis]
MEYRILIIDKQTKHTSLYRSIGILCGCLGIMIGALWAFKGVILGHSYIRNGTILIDDWQSLGIDMGIIGIIIGVTGALFGIMVGRSKV